MQRCEWRVTCQTPYRVASTSREACALELMADVAMLGAWKTNNPVQKGTSRL
jgi:hypothetical protein